MDWERKTKSNEEVTPYGQSGTFTQFTTLIQIALLNILYSPMYLVIKILQTIMTILAVTSILQARLQQYVNRELPDVQAGFRKGRGTRDQIDNMRWIMQKARVPEKHLFLLY